MSFPADYEAVYLQIIYLFIIWFEMIDKKFEKWPTRRIDAPW